MSYNYINQNGKLVTGAPAFVHYVFTVCGGVEGFVETVQEPLPIVPRQKRALLKSFAKLANSVTDCVTSIMKH